MQGTDSRLVGQGPEGGGVVVRKLSRTARRAYESPKIEVGLPDSQAGQAGIFVCVPIIYDGSVARVSASNNAVNHCMYSL